MDNGPLRQPGTGADPGIDGLTVPTPADRVVVAFQGDSSGIEEMTWGQREIWLAMTNEKNAIPIGGIKPLEPATTVEDIAAELRYLMGRYEAMRTRVHFDGTARPKQAVAGSGEIAIEIYQSDDVDPAETAAAVEAHYRATEYDYAREWPVRMAVVRRHGTLTHLVVITHHMATDAAGAMVMIREVAERTATPPAGLQPLAQAQWQRSPAGRRQNEAALRYIGGLLRTIPPRRFSTSPVRREPREWSGEFRSYATWLAVRMISGRTGFDSSPVLLTLYAVAMARLTGINPVVTRPLVGNRFRTSVSEVVCFLTQSGLCALDVAGVSFDEAIDRGRRSALSAYKYAYFDPDDVAALVAQVSAERGQDIDVGCFYNDRRSDSRDEIAGPAPTPEQLRDARSLTTFDWVHKQDMPIDRLYIHVDEVPGTIQFTVDIDTEFFSPEDAEALMYAIEAVAVEAALDPSASTGVPRPDTETALRLPVS